jgi:hypothetical protein
MSDILNDPRVTPAGDGFKVARDDGTTLTVMPIAHNEGWSAYFSGSTVEDPRPHYGIPGSLSATSAAAVEWALREETP